MFHEELAAMRLIKMDEELVIRSRKSGTVVKGYAPPSCYITAIVTATSSMNPPLTLLC